MRLKTHGAPAIIIIIIIIIINVSTHHAAVVVNLFINFANILSFFGG
jgi:hypothetical protein